jgi:hypothetical protein
MARVHAVEVADGDGARVPRRSLLMAAYDEHERTLSRGDRRVS